MNHDFHVKRTCLSGDFGSVERLESYNAALVEEKELDKARRHILATLKYTFKNVKEKEHYLTACGAHIEYGFPRIKKTVAVEFYRVKLNGGFICSIPSVELAQLLGDILSENH